MKRVFRVLGETLLTLAAIGGAACIVLVGIAFVGGYSLIMFQTGSMHPTIPAGSVALVREIEASEVRVGDVLTVDRAGALPVTHRVTRVEEGPTPGSRVIAMRGDANDADDPTPYTIHTARITVASVPHLAVVIAWFGSPWVLGGITVAAATLVTWAFWPRRDEEVHVRLSPRHTTRGRYGAILVVVGLAAGSSFGSVPRAQASQSVLAMTSSLDSDRVYSLHPTEPLLWDVTVQARAASSDGNLETAITGAGNSALGVRMTVSTCTAAWTSVGCSAIEETLLTNEAVAVNGAWQGLVSTRVPGQIFLRIALTAQPTHPPSADTARVTVRATAEGVVEDVHFAGGQELPETGEAMSWIRLLLAPIAIGLGLVIAAGGRWYRRSTGSRAVRR